MSDDTHGKHLHETPDSNNVENSKFEACYLPQPNDDVPSKDHLQPMGPISYWATGRVDWSPLAGLTGTRPVVDRYSITRFSSNEWRAKNKETIDGVHKVLNDTEKNANICKTTMARTFAIVKKTQQESTTNLKERAQLLDKWKTTIQRAIYEMIEELATLEEERVRVKKSLVILGIPESIAKECIEKRAGRPETELVRDNPEEELVKELALISEIRTTLKKTLADIEQQQIENRTARQRLEYDWSDKKESYDLESTNCGLNNNSTTIMFRPGVTRMPAEQASEEFWEHFTKETLEECEKCRLKSINLRSTLASILLNAARDLRTQADTVEKAMICRINCTQENVQRLENELKECLNKLADTESRIEKMFRAVRSFDAAMKVAHTRLDNRSYRPHVENCRDRAESGLIDEVDTIQNGVSGMLAVLRDAEEIKNQLMQTRGRLEREIMLKRRTLMLDRERCMLLRSHYPSATALSGSINM